MLIFLFLQWRLQLPFHPIQIHPFFPALFLHLLDAKTPQSQNLEASDCDNQEADTRPLQTHEQQMHSEPPKEAAAQAAAAAAKGYATLATVAQAVHAPPDATANAKAHAQAAAGAAAAAKGTLSQIQRQI